MSDQIAIVESADYEIVPGATETALVLPENMSEAEWRTLGDQLGRVSRASAWWIGDWINYGSARWGEKYEEAEALTGLSYQYLARCSAVAKRFMDRSINLSWSHYHKAYGLPDAEEWLGRADDEQWSVRELIERTATEPRTRIMPVKRHGEVVKTADLIVRLCDRWDKELTESLSPPEARKQLAILRKAQDRLAEVIEAVEYRAATLHTFAGR